MKTENNTSKLFKNHTNSWYIKPKTFQGEVVKELTYKEKPNDTDSSKSGDFETLGKIGKLIVEELPEMVGKELWDVGEYIKNKGWIPAGIEEIEHFIEIQEKSSNWIWYFFYGSLFRYSNGDWFVPYVGGSVSGFGHHGFTLGSIWDSNDRVVLLEIENLSDDSLTL